MKLKLVLLMTLALLLTGSIAIAVPDSTSLAPHVIEILPYVGEELRLDQPVTFYFDQAMNRGSVERALSIRGAVSFSLEWSDDFTLTVTPQTEWQRNTELTFTISTEALSKTGLALESAFQITFRTVGYLEVIDFLPTAGQIEVAPDSVILVTFNRPVVPLAVDMNDDTLPKPLTIDPPIKGTGEWLNTSVYLFRPDEPYHGGKTYTVTVNRGLVDVTGAILPDDVMWSFTAVAPVLTAINPYRGTERFPLEGVMELTFSQPMDTASVQAGFRLADFDTGEFVTGRFLWKSDLMTVRFIPDNLLKISSQYHLTVDAAIAHNIYGSPLQHPVDSNFFTVTYPAIVRTSPENGQTNATPYGGFSIYFSAPIDEDTLTGKIHIEPEPYQEFEGYYNNSYLQYTIYFDSAPSTTYTITIAPGIADPYDNTIDEELIVTYTTADYEPEVGLNRPGYVGVYSAYAPRTRIFATHRNVSRLDVYLYSLSLANLAAFTKGGNAEFVERWSPIAGDLIRSWSVDVQSPRNVRRYELLMLSEEGESGIQNVQCLGAPAARLQVGQFVKIAYGDVQEPAPLNLRDDPNLLGNVIERLEPDAQLEIVGGPICNDSYIWWQTQLPNTDVIGWTVEGTFETLFLTPVDESIEIPELQAQVDLALPGLPPGVYFVHMLAPETEALDYEPIEHIAVVATANITLKRSAGQVLAWVTDMESGDPVPDASVQFYDADFRLLAIVRTDADGIAVLNSRRLEQPQQVYAVVQDEDNFGFVTNSWSNGIGNGGFISYATTPSNLTTYLYTERPLYRPDQTVYFRGIVRNRDDVTLRIPPDIKTVTVQIFNSGNEVVFEDDLPLTDYGTFSGEFKLDAEAALGGYRIRVDFDVTDNYIPTFYFNVAEYVAPEFQMSVTPAEPEVIQGDLADVLVESSYFFGGGVSHAEVKWTVITNNYYFNYAGEGRYSFADVDEDFRTFNYSDGYGEHITEGESETDSQGRFLIQVPTDLNDRSQSQVFTIEAQISEESSHYVVARATLVVHQGEVYIGLQPDKYISTAGVETLIHMISVDTESQIVPNQTVDVQVVEQRWYSVMEENEMGRAVWTWDLEEIPVELDQASFTTDENGRAEIRFVPPNGGTFKVSAVTRDERGNTIRSSTYVWVGGQREYVAWRPQNNNNFDLITDADEYRVGDTAEILIPSPFQGTATALVTIERAGIFEHEVVKLDNNSPIYKLPITEDYAPDIYVSVMLVKGVDVFSPFAQFRVGVAHLSVNKEQFVLNIDVDSSVAEGDFAGPGDEVTYILTLRSQVYRL